VLVECFGKIRIGLEKKETFLCGDISQMYWDHVRTVLIFTTMSFVSLRLYINGVKNQTAENKQHTHT